MIERHGLVLGRVRDRFAWSKQVSDAQGEESVAIRDEVTTALAAMLGSDGVMVFADHARHRPLLGTDEAGLEDYRNNAIKLLCLAGLSGFPQLSMPLARRNGARSELSLLGPAGSDRSLIAMAQRIAVEG